MSNSPAKFLPLYLIATLFFWAGSGFCASRELAQAQKEARVYRIKGYDLQKKGEIGAAISCYEQALLLDPNYVEAYNDLGILLEDSGQKEKAKEKYLKAIEISPRYPSSYSNLALLYEGEQDYTNAILCWIKRAMFTDEGDPWREAAKKRIKDIARVYPEVYRNVSGEYKEYLQKLGISEGPFTKEIAPLIKEEPKTKKAPKPAGAQKEHKLSQPSKEPLKPSPLTEGTASRQDLENKTSAGDYLKRAKENFSRGQYVAALKEATIAGYLDPSNEEINAFVEKVRKKLLR